MAHGQKRINLVAGRTQCKGVGPLFGCYARELLHRLRVEYVDGARVSDGNVEALVYAIKKHNVWRSTQRVLTEDFSGMGIERDQHPRVAGAEQPTSVEIEIKSMRAGRRDGECAIDAFGVPRV